MEIGKGVTQLRARKNITTPTTRDLKFPKRIFLKNHSEDDRSFSLK